MVLIYVSVYILFDINLVKSYHIYVALKRSIKKKKTHLAFFLKSSQVFSKLWWWWGLWKWRRKIVIFLISFSMWSGPDQEEIRKFPFSFLVGLARHWKWYEKIIFLISFSMWSGPEEKIRKLVCSFPVDLSRSLLEGRGENQR